MLHEPVAVGKPPEVVMVIAFDVNARSLAANARDVLESGIVGAGMIICSSEHGNRHFSDILELNEWSLIHSSIKLVREFLESLGIGIHPIVLFRLNTLAFKISGHAFEGVASFLAIVVAQSLHISVPVRPVISIDSEALERIPVIVVTLDSVTAWVKGGVEAWCQLHDLVDVLSMKFFFAFAQTIKHLNSALAVANVEHFVDACVLFDHLDVCNVVVEPHVGPGIHPVFVVVS